MLNKRIAYFRKGAISIRNPNIIETQIWEATIRAHCHSQGIWKLEENVCWSPGSDYFPLKLYKNDPYPVVKSPKCPVWERITSVRIGELTTPEDSLDSGKQKHSL